MNTEQEKKPLEDLYAKKVPKLNFETIANFAKFASQSQEVIELLRRQENWKEMSDEEIEDNEWDLTKFARDYLVSKNIEVKYVTSLKEGYRIVRLKMFGKIGDEHDESSMNSLRNSRLVNFPNGD